MGDLGHSYTEFYVCRLCGVTQYEANVGGIACTGVEEDQDCDTPLIVDEPVSVQESSP